MAACQVAQTALRHVDLRRCVSVTDAGIQRLLSAFPRLISFQLDGTAGFRVGCTDVAAFAVAGLAGLVTLKLRSMPKLRDAGIAVRPCFAAPRTREAW